MQTREYHSPLRDAQADATRERVLDAAIDILVEEGPSALTQRAIARRADVSAPTVARYLPDAESIAAGLDLRISERLGLRAAPTDPEGMISLLRTAFTGMDREERVMRAYLAASEHRRSSRHRRRDLIEGAFHEALSPLGKEDAPRVMAALHLFASANTWSQFRDVWGLDGEDAILTAQWAMRTLFEAALRTPPSRTLHPCDEKV